MRYGKFSEGWAKDLVDHLVEFIKDDLKGSLTITQEHDPDAYQDIMFDIVLNEEIDNEGEGRMYLKELWNALEQHKENILYGNKDLDLRKYRSVIRKANRVSDYHLRRVR